MAMWKIVPSARAAGMVAVVAILSLAMTASSSAQTPFLKCWLKPACPTCPPSSEAYEPGALTTPPQVMTPQPGGDLAPSPVATAALVGPMASMGAPNLFGDKFGGPGAVRFSIRDSFSFISAAAAGSTPQRLTFINPTNVPTQRGVIIPAGMAFQSRDEFTVSSIPPKQIAMLNNPAAQALSAAPLPPGVTEMTVGRGDHISGGDFNDPATYRIFYEYLHTGEIPNPSRAVGRANISEDGNFLPRDRIIFNFDYFDEARLTQGGWDVYRYVLGLEKTFLNQLCSLEVRLPFAATLNSDLVEGAESTNTELGNLRLIFRALLWNTQTFHVGAGIGVDLPTADDGRLHLSNGVEFARIENEAVILLPYAGFLWTPTERFFAQFWAAMDFDANGNPVLANNGFGLQNIGRLHDSAFMQLDAQLGYWLIRSQQPSSFLQGLAPFVELHYGSTVEDAEFVSGNGVNFGNTSNRIDNLSLTVGLITMLRPNLMVSLGAVAPLRTGDDEPFDYQLGLRVNWFFGPTARQNNFTPRPF